MGVRAPLGSDTQSKHEHLAVSATTHLQPLCAPTQAIDRVNHSSTTKTTTAATIHGVCLKPKIVTTKAAAQKLDEPSLKGEGETTKMMQDNLKAYLTPDVLRRYQIKLLNPAYYWDMRNLEPPITKISLSELDLVRIINDPKLRHDINFEREITFKPNDRGEHLKGKLHSAQMYWEALIIEFSLYSRRSRSPGSQDLMGHDQKTSTTNLTELSALRHVAIRLPHTFTAIREILKTLVPGSEWAAIDERLDVDLLIQELENGVCDIKGLADWLQSLLLRSCSPLRDHQVHKMVTMVHEGVDKDDAHLLVSGLRDLFGILETMKLDVANHQIRYLRLLMVEDTVHFEQKTFLQRIANGWDYDDARGWLDSDCGSETALIRPHPYLPKIVRGMIELVSDDRPKQPWPSNLLYDVDRLMALKIDLHVIIYRRACLQACDATIRAFGRQTPMAPEECERLWKRIEAVLEIEVSGQNLLISDRNSILEIVREACRICGVLTLPEEGLLSFAEWHIHLCMNPKYRGSQRLRDDLARRLTEMVDIEVQGLVGMTPLQMLHYASQRPRDQETDDESRRLLGIARRLAHISVLHWRIWTPILYDQPQDNITTTMGLSATVDNLSLAGSTSENPSASQGEKEISPGNANSGDALDLQSSTTGSSSSPSEIATADRDPEESNAPPKGCHQ